jgi:hypothetical protein
VLMVHGALPAVVGDAAAHLPALSTLLSLGIEPLPVAASAPVPYPAPVPVPVPDPGLQGDPR